MVYAGNIGKQKVSLGVSGRLRKRNLVMWDEETNSLWSQITGEALYGKSKGKRLDMLPAVFVSMQTWLKMHPKTKVLDMLTVQHKGWFYTSKDLTKGKAEGQALAIGLRHEKTTLAIPMSHLHQHPRLEVELDGIPLLVVWQQEDAAVLVYQRPVEDFHIKDYDLLTGKAKEGESELQRFPYIPTYLKAWQTYYPDGKVLQAE
jgi:hypothetical protein